MEGSRILTRAIESQPLSPSRALVSPTEGATPGLSSATRDMPAALSPIPSASSPLFLEGNLVARYGKKKIDYDKNKKKATIEKWRRRQK